MTRISVVIITFNEEKNISRCMDSVKNFADEIIVVDSFSTDNTRLLCLSKGAKFIERKFEGFTSQKEFAVQQATHDYIFALDADEYVSSELEQSILEVKTNWNSDGYVMNRLNSYAGKWIKSGHWYPDSKIRLWDRRKGNWKGMVHEVVVMDPGCVTALLQGDLLHEAYQNASQLITKMQQQYADLFAQQHAFRKKVTPFMIFYKTVVAFMKSYILQGAILDGYEGFVISGSNANGVFYKYAKLLELNASLKTSLVIVTNTLEPLEIVFISILNQSVMPDEVVVADVNSGEKTQALIELYRPKFPVPLHYAANCDAEKAISKTSHEYILTITGNVVLHKDFVEAHKRYARKGQLLRGGSVVLDEYLTSYALKHKLASFNFFSRGIKNRTSALYLPAISFVRRCQDVNFIHSTSFNFSFWKEDLIQSVIESISKKESLSFIINRIRKGFLCSTMKFVGFGYQLSTLTDKRA